MKVFIDTNILLDVLTGREPFFATSQRIWNLTEKRHIEGLVSLLSFKDVFYILSKGKNKKGAREGIIAMRNIFTPVPMDSRVLTRAIDSELEDLEDALQLFTALHAHADCLVTRDRRYPDDYIPVFSPEQFLASLKLSD